MFLLYEFLARELKIQARFPSIQPQEHLEYSNSPLTALVKDLLLQTSYFHSASMYSPAIQTHCCLSDLSPEVR